MKTLIDSLHDYFSNTPKEILDNDWNEIKHLNEIGPDIDEYISLTKQYNNTEAAEESDSLSSKQ